MGHSTDEHMTSVSDSNGESIRARVQRKLHKKGGHMGHRHGHSHGHFGPHSRGHGGHGRHRAKRGAAVEATLWLLGERPMHGYELITEMTERSGGRWQPSPGTIYPALNRMEERGLVEAEEIDAKRRFALTDAGRTRLAELHEARGDDGGAPWDDPGTGHHGDLRGKVAELVGQVRQVGRFGTSEQADEAGKVLDDAKRRLYAILATEPVEASADVDAD